MILNTDSTYRKILQQYWGYDDFRPLQLDIIRSVGNGEDTLGLMPTGGGKSITFQVPTLAMEGLCLVVTPLIALMKDQVENLRRKGIKAEAIYTGMSRERVENAYNKCIYGGYKFLYISPERLTTELFRHFLDCVKVCLIAIDEAHCISQWGYDFRPSYQRIAEIREFLPEVPILALTATATPEVVQDIQDKLSFRHKNVFRKSFYRDNLHYIVRKVGNKSVYLKFMLSKELGCTIVYARSRNTTETLAKELREAGFSADYFHAGLSFEEKEKRQNLWKDDQIRIIVCTNAFGMGIDKPNVRLVIHYDMPDSLEAYYQEAGRAGRDGLSSYAVLLHSDGDSASARRRLSSAFPEPDYIRKVYDKLAYYFEIPEGGGQDKSYPFNLFEFTRAYSLNSKYVLSSIEILSLSGYIDFVDENENSSRVSLLVDRRSLYDLSLGSDFLDQVLETLLRLYSGLFSSYAYISEEEIAAYMENTDQKRVYDALILLAKMGVISYIPFKRLPFIKYNYPRIAGNKLKIKSSVYEDRRKRYSDKIENMIYYVEDDSVCRSKKLQYYFGEKDTDSCGKCDVCARKKAESNPVKIRERVDVLLSKGPISLNSLINQIGISSQKVVVTYVRMLIDEGILLLQDDLLIKKAK